jgi:hypothetical protein
MLNLLQPQNITNASALDWAGVSFNLFTKHWQQFKKVQNDILIMTGHYEAAASWDFPIASFMMKRRMQFTFSPLCTLLGNRIIGNIGTNLIVRF